jgi:hypothetical protein
MSSWRQADPTKCNEEARPKDLWQHPEQSSIDKEILHSTHPWCQSCYSLYKQVCAEIAVAFQPNIKLDDYGEFKTSDFNTAVTNFLNQGYENSDGANLEPLRLRTEAILVSILNCIKARRVHHSYCYKSTLQRGIMRGDSGHEAFIISLGQGLYKIKSLYVDILNTVNTFYQRRFKKPKLESVIDRKEHRAAVAVIDHYIRHAGHEPPTRHTVRSKFVRTKPTKSCPRRSHARSHYKIKPLRKQKLMDSLNHLSLRG